MFELTREMQAAIYQQNKALWQKVFHMLTGRQLSLLRMADLQIVRLATETVKTLDESRFNDIISTRSSP